MSRDKLMPPHSASVKNEELAEHIPNRIEVFFNNINGRKNLPELHTRVRFPSSAPKSL